MIKKYKWYIIIAIALIIYLLMTKKKNILSTLQNLLSKFEGYRANPYWDVSRWSWGYGTQVPDSIANPSIFPDSAGSISKADAMHDAINFSTSQQATLRKYLKTDLKPNQWAALLSFTYNEGIGSGIKLVNVINAGDMAAISKYWNEYVYSKDASGVEQINPDLVQRRAEEFALFEND